MDDNTRFGLPWSLVERMYLLVMGLVVIVAALLVEVIRCRSWRPWLKFVGTVVLVVAVVLVLRAPPAHPVDGPLLR